MADPRDWWQVHPDDWKPISSFKGGKGPFVFANADKTRTWLSPGGKKPKLRSDGHELGEDGNSVGEGPDAAFWVEA